MVGGQTGEQGSAYSGSLCLDGLIFVDLIRPHAGHTSIPFPSLFVLFDHMAPRVTLARDLALNGLMAHRHVGPDAGSLRIIAGFSTVRSFAPCSDVQLH
jgi:hypothetical protein